MFPIKSCRSLLGGGRERKRSARAFARGKQDFLAAAHKNN